MKLDIVFAPHPALLHPAQTVKKVDKKIKTIIRDMQEILLSCTDPVGVGLAAPQVGIGLQIFITKPSARSQITAYINPLILSHSSKKILEQDALEGCLSIKNIWGNVARFKQIELSYTTINNTQKTQVFKGYTARIIQHEMDHLKGILFTQRVLEQKTNLYTNKKQNGREKLVPFEL